MLIAAEIAIDVILFMIGASVFSFLNVVIYRMPRNMSFISGRSICPSCKTNLRPLDLIPVFSFLGLRGKCRYCGTKIPARDTLVEAFGGVLVIFLFDHCKSVTEGVFLFLVACVLTVVAGIDADSMEIPNVFPVILLVMGIVAVFLFPEITLIQRLIGLVCISVPLLLITLVVPGGFGGGDMKLMAAAGFLCGWKLILLAFFVAVLGGGVYGMFLLASKKKGRKDHFAFGPFLCAGILVSLFWGNEIIAWYLSFLPTYY